MRSLERLSDRDHSQRECLRDTRRLSEVTQHESDTKAAEKLQREVVARIDSDVLKSIEKRHGDCIPSERLRRARESSPTTLPREQYEALLQSQSGISHEEAHRVLGHYDPRLDKVYVTSTYPLTRQVLAHERLHQLSDPQVTSILGPGLEEGVTQWLARDAAGDPQFADQPEVYPRGVRVVDMLGALAGEKTLKRAYFQGNQRELEQRVEAELGKGALAKITHLSDQNRYDEIERFIRHKSKDR